MNAALNLVILASLAALGYLLWQRQGVAPLAFDAGGGAEVPPQLVGPVESLAIMAERAVESVGEAFTGQGDPPADLAAANVRAFLDMIAYAEGTGGPTGYRMMFGGGLFDSFADHPRQFFSFTNSRGQVLRTSAAGRYQFLSRTWDTLKARLSLPDFGPSSQDAAAIELIRERGALPDVQAGRVVEAVAKVRPIWASLPGAGYAQPERSINSLVAMYQASGGTMEA